ncbi:MAG TPA: MFS transporter [Chloroflexia bacterium]|nr:MFS transporter [Chloroflexia bacterium]
MSTDGKDGALMHRLRRFAAGSLWQHPDFLRLWAGQSISLLGSQISALALPLTAVLLLNATPLQMGVLGASQTVPWLLIGLPAGAWVDRLPRRPLLLAGDLSRALLLSLIPITAACGLLRIEWLYLVAFLTGGVSVVFEVAYNAYLPGLVGRPRLVEGNSKLLATSALAEVAGPSLAGALVQVIGAPAAIVGDVLSFLVSGTALLLIRTPEPVPPSPAARHLGREMREGLALVLRHPILRVLVASSTCFNLGAAISGAVQVVYATRELGLAPAALGGVLAGGSLGSVLGASSAGRLARRYGLGPTIIGSVLCITGGTFLLPLAAGPPLLAGAVFTAGLLSIGCGAFIYIITAGSLRQALTPDHLQGRAAATARFISRSALPVGFLLGGALSEQVGFRWTLAAAGGWLLLTTVALAASPLRRLHNLSILHE